jgi:hypothetical protein
MTFTIFVLALHKKKEENKFASGKDHEKCVRMIFSAPFPT